MAVIRAKHAPKPREKRKPGTPGKPASADRNPKAGPGQRMLILAGAGLLFNFGVYGLANQELATMVSDKPIALPKVTRLSDRESTDLGTSLYEGLFTTRRTEITLGDLNAMCAGRPPKETAKPGSPESEATEPLMYFLPQEDRVIAVTSLPLDAFSLKGKFFNPTILFEPKVIKGEPKPLLKVSKVQINKQDLSEAHFHRFNNLVNFTYGVVGVFARFLSHLSEGRLEAPSDEAVKGDVLEAVRIATDPDGTVEFNPTIRE